MEDPGILGIACPEGKDVSEVATMDNTTLKHNREETFAVELHRALGCTKDGGVSIFNRCHTDGEAHPKEIDNNLLQGDEADEVIHQHVLDDVVYFPDC